jgi:hypothetical protein
MTEGKPVAQERSAAQFETITGPAEFVPREIPRFYANNTQFQISPWDVSLDFGQIVGQTEDRRLLVENLVRVVMSPQHAKVIAHLLMTQLAMYESEFGTIPSPPIVQPPKEDEP